MLNLLRQDRIYFDNKLIEKIDEYIKLYNVKSRLFSYLYDIQCSNYIISHYINSDYNLSKSDINLLFTHHPLKDEDMKYLFIKYGNIISSFITKGRFLHDIFKYDEYVIEYIEEIKIDNINILLSLPFDIINTIKNKLNVDKNIFQQNSNIDSFQTKIFIMNILYDKIETNCSYQFINTHYNIFADIDLIDNIVKLYDGDYFAINSCMYILFKSSSKRYDIVYQFLKLAVAEDILYIIDELMRVNYFNSSDSILGYLLTLFIDIKWNSQKPLKATRIKAARIICETIVDEYIDKYEPKDLFYMNDNGLSILYMADYCEIDVDSYLNYITTFDVKIYRKNKTISNILEYYHSNKKQLWNFKMHKLFPVEFKNIILLLILINKSKGIYKIPKPILEIMFSYIEITYFNI